MQAHSKRLCFFLCTLQNKDEWRNGYTCAICAFEYNICWCILHKLHCGSCQLTWICVKLQQCWRSFISSGKFNVRFFTRSLPPTRTVLDDKNEQHQMQNAHKLLNWLSYWSYSSFFILCCIFMEIELFEQFNRSLWYSKIFQWTIWLFRWIILSVRACATRMLYSIEIDVTLKSDEWIGKKIWIH